MKVRTKHSDYTLCVADGTLSRSPRAPESARLRADFETVELLDVMVLEEGKPAVFLIQLPHVDGPTVRRTTAVESIDWDAA